jgi:hypothetical protein
MFDYIFQNFCNIFPHQICGNYLLFNKNLIKELNDKNNDFIGNKV